MGICSELTLLMRRRPSTHEQQLDTMRKPSSSIVKFACGCFGLVVSLVQYPTMVCSKLCALFPPFDDEIVAIALQTGKKMKNSKQNE